MNVTSAGTKVGSQARQSACSQVAMQLRSPDLSGLHIHDAVARRWPFPLPRPASVPTQSTPLCATQTMSMAPAHPATATPRLCAHMLVSLAERSPVALGLFKTGYVCLPSIRLAGVHSPPRLRKSLQAALQPRSRPMSSLHPSPAASLSASPIRWSQCPCREVPTSHALLLG